jgi:hypothetical protein
MGKPGAAKFILECPPDERGELPNQITIQNWLPAWKDLAAETDDRIRQELDDRTVAAKVEMFDRHAKIGKEMQEISLSWLQNHRDELTPGTAVRMLVDGIEIEQSTIGVSDAIKKMLDMSDEELRDDIVERLTSGQIEILDADRD